MTRRIARRAWRILRPGHTRAGRVHVAPPPEPTGVTHWDMVPDWEPPLPPLPRPDQDALLEADPDGWRVVPWEDVLRREIEAKTRRLRGDT